MKFLGLIALFLVLSPSVFATEVTGKVLFYDCSQLVAKPVNPKFAAGCIVIVAGQTSGTAQDGTKWTNNATQLVVSSQKLASKIQSALSSGATVTMEINLKSSTLRDINTLTVSANKEACSAACSDAKGTQVLATRLL